MEPELLLEPVALDPDDWAPPAALELEDLELPGFELLVLELDVFAPVVLELEGPEPVDLELDGLELADLELLGLELVDLELVDLELVERELVDREPLDLGPLDLELVDLELVDLEPAGLAAPYFEPLDFDRVVVFDREVVFDRDEAAGFDRDDDFEPDDFDPDDFEPDFEPDDFDPDREPGPLDAAPRLDRLELSERPPLPVEGELPLFRLVLVFRFGMRIKIADKRLKSYEGRYLSVGIDAVCQRPQAGCSLGKLGNRPRRLMNWSCQSCHDLRHSRGFSLVRMKGSLRVETAGRRTDLGDNRVSIRLYAAVRLRAVVVIRPPALFRRNR